ncbi:MAG: zf-HC2 domain-containing protein [Ignavibacteriaceae bacterium]
MNTKDLELLSAYVDGELNEKERQEIEQKIKLSPVLQQELVKLQKLKKLTYSSVKKLEESPYFETRLMASLSSEKTSGSKLKKWSPAIGFGLLAVFLMIFLKYNPDAIDEIVQQQQSNLAGFYKENLKPLLFAADLSNEDIFNFAFYHQLPLDKDDYQVLQLGYSNTGEEFFEIKTSDLPFTGGNYDKFISALELNEKEKKQMDSILESYKDELELQVLANEKNTIAINPNLWNYNKAIAADLIAFAKDANMAELSKIIPGDIPLYTHGNVKRIVNEVKSARPNEFIFLTPDTIFSEEFVFDMKKFKEELKQMETELRKADKELKKVDFTVNLNRNLAKLRKDSSLSKDFKIDFDSNFYRVQFSKIDIPEIVIPDFNDIAAQIEEATKHIQSFTVSFPGNRKSRGDIRVRVGSDSLDSFDFNFRVPDLDSITHFVPFQVDSLIKQFSRNFNFNRSFNLDSLVSSYNFNFSDSLHYQQNQEFRQQMKEFEKEMQKFKEEMENMKRDLKKDSNKVNKKKGIVI